MDKIRLSARLQAVADFVPPEARLADIGSDHAFLPAYLVQTGKINFAVAGEVVDGPFRIAKNHIESANLHNNIYVKKANGLDAIDVSEQIDTVVIAGMGGILIADILKTGQEKLDSITRLILQPNNHEDTLRHWLVENHFTIVAEQILLDADKFYEIIVAEPESTNLTKLSKADFRFGPFLSREKSVIFRQKWEKELSTLDKILLRLPEEQAEKRFEMLKKQAEIKEVLS